MTILIINNYCKKVNLNKVDQILSVLREIKKRYVVWRYHEIDIKKTPDQLEAIILSGSEAHIQDQGCFSKYQAEIDFIRQIDAPILGICFGHQLIAKAFGSKIESLENRSNDFQKVRILEPNEIFSTWKPGDEILVCQSHKDYVAAIPNEFVCLAVSQVQSKKTIEGMKHKTKPVYGVQAHIERATKEKPDGRQVLENFIFLT